MQLYFAYGSNMAAAAMARRCPGARLLGPARLYGHRFAIIRGGHGSVLRSAGFAVHGVLWRLGAGNLGALDRYEEVARGLYRRARVTVDFGGKPVAALVYVAAAIAPGKPRAAYLAAILAAAREFGFPADYCAALAAWSARSRTAAGVRPASRSARNVTAPSRFA